MPFMDKTDLVFQLKAVPLSFLYEGIWLKTFWIKIIKVLSTFIAALAHLIWEKETRILNSYGGYFSFKLKQPYISGIWILETNSQNWPKRDTIIDLISKCFWSSYGKEQFHSYDIEDPNKGAFHKNAPYPNHAIEELLWILGYLVSCSYFQCHFCSTLFEIMMK